MQFFFLKKKKIENRSNICNDINARLCTSILKFSSSLFTIDRYLFMRKIKKENSDKHIEFIK